MDGKYLGHTVVDEVPELETGAEEDAQEENKFLLRESFVLC